MMIHRYDMSAIKGTAREHWKIQNIQPFLPALEKLFKTETLDNPSLYGIRFSEEVMTILSPDTIRTTQGKEVEVHKKSTMLLSPYKWMRGNYGSALGLPTTEENSKNVISKLQNPNNAGYVGAIISAALSSSGCLHFPKVYGLFTGMSEEHTIDISDDYGDICERPWFSQNIGKLFEIKLSDEIRSHIEFNHTRGARKSLKIGEQIDLGAVEELDVPQVDENVTIGNLQQVLHDDEECDCISDSSSVSTENMFDIESCDCETDDEDESITNDDETCEPFAWATFRNVPVQITLMEKCAGTLYELIVMNPEPEKHIAWMSQVMFALAYAQRNFGLTHNDLHANNVMYVPYDKEFLYYNCGGQLYKVPTFGYLIKIIDFERGIASLKITGMKEPKLFMSDHYDLEEEAGGMYNYEDYYNPKYPEIKPNPSCDLSRLATSLYWDLFEEEDNSLLCKLFKKWLTIEDGSVLFGKKDPRHERYHGFELYKAISRYCKDNAVPRKEINALKELYGIESGGENVLLVE